MTIHGVFALLYMCISDNTDDDCYINIIFIYSNLLEYLQLQYMTIDTTITARHITDCKNVNEAWVNYIMTPHKGGPVAFSTAIITCGYYLFGAESFFI